MIVLFSTNDNPVTGSGVKCQEGAPSFPTSTPKQDLVNFCFCDYECEYTETAFVDLNDLSDDSKNDKADLLVQLNDPNGSVKFYLVNIQNGEETELNDDTYGTYFPLGFESQNSNKSGVYVEWSKVVQAFGFGFYRLKTVITQYNQDSTLETYRFRAKPYAEDLADGTIVIKTKPDGYIEDGFDYRFLNWERQIRVNGMLSNFNPIPEITDYEDSNRDLRQIQTRVFREYDLQIELVPQEIFLPLFRDTLLSNVLMVSDYNIFNPLQKVRDLSLNWAENNGLDQYSRNKNITVNLKMKEMKQNTVKRQY